MAKRLSLKIRMSKPISLPKKPTSSPVDWEDMFENPNVGFLTQLGQVETAADLRRGMVMILSSIYTRKSDEAPLSDHIKSLEVVLPDDLTPEQLKTRRRACLRALRTIKHQLIAEAETAMAPDEAAPMPSGPRRRKGDPSSTQDKDAPARGPSKAIFGFAAGGALIAATVASFILTRGDVHPSKVLVKEMVTLHETTDFRGGSGTHSFGGALDVISRFDRRAVKATNVPPEVCAGAAWSLANRGTIEINGALPTHVRTHELKTQCAVNGDGAELVWFPSED